MSHIPVPLIIRRDKGWDPAGREAIEAIERRRICPVLWPLLSFPNLLAY